MDKKECEGRCSLDGDCEGKVRRVSVVGRIGPLKNTFRFNYCETAIERDRQNGFEVEDILI